MVQQEREPQELFHCRGLKVQISSMQIVTGVISALREIRVSITKEVQT